MNDELLKLQQNCDNLDSIISGIASSETVMSMALRMIEESMNAAQGEAEKKRLSEIKDVLILSRDRILTEQKGLESIASILPRTIDHIAEKVEKAAKESRK